MQSLKDLQKCCVTKIKQGLATKTGRHSKEKFKCILVGTVGSIYYLIGKYKNSYSGNTFREFSILQLHRKCCFANTCWKSYKHIYLVLFGEVAKGLASDPDGYGFNSRGRKSSLSYSPPPTFF